MLKAALEASWAETILVRKFSKGRCEPRVIDLRGRCRRLAGYLRWAERIAS